MRQPDKHCRNSSEVTDFLCDCLSGGWVNGHIPTGEQSAQELVSCKRSAYFQY